MTVKTYGGYLVVTVRKKSVGVEVRMKQPKSLEPNQMAYHFSIEIDEDKWFKRVHEIDLGKVNPPETKMGMNSPDFGDTTAQKVMKRMVGTP